MKGILPQAGKCTLNRLELTGAKVDGQERYKKIAMDADKVDRWMVDAFVSAHETAPEEIVLDLDATDDPIHGAQHAIVSFAQAEVCLNAGLHVLALPFSMPPNPCLAKRARHRPTF